MDKKIVTHFAPDLDAVTSVWLIKRFMPGWERADVLFVPAGETLDDQSVDSNQNIIHVDTGLGKFDHHQLDEDTCSAKKIFDFLRAKKSRHAEFISASQIPKRVRNDKSRVRNDKSRVRNDIEEVLKRLVEVVNDIDHFHEVFWPNPTADFYDFGLEMILDGLKLIWHDQDERIVEFGLEALDGIYKKFQNKIWAEKLLKEEGIKFKTEWGKGIGIETTNDDVITLAQKQGCKVVLRKDSKKGYVRIKARPEEGISLKKEFEKFKKADPKATWFFHSSGCMILNGSTKNPKTKPTKLSLKEMIEILRGGVKKNGSGKS